MDAIFYLHHLVFQLSKLCLPIPPSLVTYVSYSTIVLYSRDNGGVGVADDKIPPKSLLTQQLNSISSAQNPPKTLLCSYYGFSA